MIVIGQTTSKRTLSIETELILSVTPDRYLLGPRSYSSRAILIGMVWFWELGRGRENGILCSHCDGRMEWLSSKLQREWSVGGLKLEEAKKSGSVDVGQDVQAASDCNR